MDTVISKIEKKIAGDLTDSENEPDVVINRGSIPDVPANQSPVIAPTEIIVDVSGKQSNQIGDTCYSNFFAKH